MAKEGRRKKLTTKQKKGQKKPRNGKTGLVGVVPWTNGRTERIRMVSILDRIQTRQERVCVCRGITCVSRGITPLICDIIVAHNGAITRKEQSSQRCLEQRIWVTFSAAVCRADSIGDGNESSIFE
eukprot:scaffold533_cov226-Pinguiococcus_pyrenoidosus.AAC.2